MLYLIVSDREVFKHITGEMINTVLASSYYISLPFFIDIQFAELFS